MFAFMLGALVATTPGTAPVLRPVVTRVILDPAQLERERQADAAAKSTKKLSPPDLATMLKMFDTFFPPQPDPDPARLALARTTVVALVPPDALGKAMGDMMGGLVERVLDMREADFPAPKPGAKKAPSDATLRQSLVAKDPHFDERMRLTRAAATTEFMRVSAIIEPRLRDGLARAVARRFDQRQLTDINGFFATDSGKSLGNHFLGLWFDPDLMRSMVKAMPDMMQVMPGSMERIAAATAHLPKPPKSTAPKTRPSRR